MGLLDLLLSQNKVQSVYMRTDTNQSNYSREGCRNTKSDGVTPEGQLQLRVKFWLEDELNEGIID